MSNILPTDLDQRFAAMMPNSRLMSQDQQYQQYLAQQNYAMSNQAGQTSLPTSHDRAYSLFIARLVGVKGEYHKKPNDFLWTHVADDQVHVFFLLGGQAGHVNESIDMFPSDTLITQFRMLI